MAIFVSVCVDNFFVLPDLKSLNKLFLIPISVHNLLTVIPLRSQRDSISLYVLFIQPRSNPQLVGKMYKHRNTDNISLDILVSPMYDKHNGTRRTDIFFCVAPAEYSVSRVLSIGNYKSVTKNVSGAVKFLHHATKGSEIG